MSIAPEVVSRGNFNQSKTIVSAHLVNTLEAISSRKAVKHFDPEHSLTPDEEKTLLAHVRRSPTAFNVQNWRFVLAKDKELLEKIREVSWGQAQVTDCSLLFILCADLKAWDKSPERYWRKAPEEVQGFMIPAIGEYYRGKEQVQRDEAMRSCGIAAQTIMLAARAMGYDSCPMDGFDFDAVGKLINLPDDHVISMFVAVGKATQEGRENGGTIPDEEIFIIDRF
jgi:nitroreductase